MPGELTFKPLQLELQQSFKQDPYVYCKIGDQELKTNRGLPQGNNSYSFDKGNTLQFFSSWEPSLRLKIKDADKKEPDDEIGDVKIDLDILESKGEQTTWLDVYHKSKIIGRLLLEGHYEKEKKGYGMSNPILTYKQPLVDKSHGGAAETNIIRPSPYK